ncbi:MAG: hypothetical protein ACP5NP_06390 [Acetobacteraceae bacterium]
MIPQHLGASPRTIAVDRARVLENLGVHGLPVRVMLAQAARDPSAHARY